MITRTARTAALWLGLTVVGLALATPVEAVDGNGSIAFMSSRGGGNAVWAMNADGSGQHRLTRTHHPAWVGYPSYSPDGRRITYTCANFDICVMNADGSDPVAITHHPWLSHAVEDSVPTWSPNGSQIAFDRLQHGVDHLYVVNVDGTGLRQLTHGLLDEDANWSPDGTQIAFDGMDRNRNPQVFVINIDGTNRRQLTTSATTYAEAPSWSPNGQQLAYTRASDDFGIFHLWIVNADGTGNHSLTSGPWGQADVAWSPDGQELTYDSNQGYHENIWTVRPDGTGQTQLTHGHTFDVDPNWQPTVSPPPVAPLPATTRQVPARPTPEARLAAIETQAQQVLNEDAAEVHSGSPGPVAALGTQLIHESKSLRRQVLAIVPQTPWGRRFKLGTLAMLASARAAGIKLNAALVAALFGYQRLVNRDSSAAFHDILSMFNLQTPLIDAL